jgi:hypothetical protein
MLMWQNGTFSLGLTGFKHLEESLMVVFFFFFFFFFFAFSIDQEKKNPRDFTILER